MCRERNLSYRGRYDGLQNSVNHNRNVFAFEKWKDWDNILFNKIKDSKLNCVVSPVGKIYGFDKAPSAIEKSATNIKMPVLRILFKSIGPIFLTLKKWVIHHFIF